LYDCEKCFKYLTTGEEDEEGAAKGDKQEPTMIQSLTISEAPDADDLEQYEIVVSLLLIISV
jgi:hypothetical protein